MHKRIVIPIFLICIGLLTARGIVQISKAKPTQEYQIIEESHITKHIRVGIASWYSNKEYPPGSLMANGEEFDDEKYTCASWDYPLGTLLKVTALYDDFYSDSKSVEVVVTDRGPAKVLYKKGRILDLSKSAFSALDDLDKGLIQVGIEVTNADED